MPVRILNTNGESDAYNTWVQSHPSGSLWQSLEWKRYQESLGRETRIYVLFEGTQILASALAIIDRTAFGFSTWDIQRGPLGPRMDNGKLIIKSGFDSLLKQIITDAQNDRCLSIYLSPPESLSIINYPLRPSGRHEQPEATRLIDLTYSEEEILTQMKPKGRYNISVAQKNSVRVEKSQDINAFYDLLQETGGRDQFGIKPLKHYVSFLRNLQGSYLFLAFSPQDEPIAGLLGVMWGKKGIYYYGASKYDSRALMAPYALQWAAIQHCKALGCVSYDLLGIAPPDAPDSHPWHGVSTFKEKFGGAVITYQPEQQLILRPVIHRLLQLKRKIID